MKDLKNKFQKKWINTFIELAWDGEKYIERRSEGYWYEGELSLAHTSPNIDEASYRWRDDNGSESAATWLELVNTSHDFDISAGNVQTRLRFLIQETAGGSKNNFTGTLEFQINGGGYVSLGAATTGAIYYNSANLTDAGDTTQQIGAGTFITPNQGISELGSAGGVADFSGNDETEYEYTVELIAADLSDGDSLDFRINEADTYTNTANATVSIPASNVTETIPNGSLTLTGIAPLTSITGNISETIPSSSLVLTGVAPLAAVAIANTTEQIPSGSLTLSSFAPATDITPGATEQIPAGSLTLNGVAPLSSITGNAVESIPSSNLTLNSFAPTVSDFNTIEEPIPSTNLTLSSFAPATTITGHVRESIQSASLTLNSFAPLDSITGNARESISSANLFLTGFAPSATVTTDNTTERPPASNLFLNGFAPNTAVAGNTTEQIPPGELRLVPVAPSVTNTGAALTVEKPTGGLSKRAKQRKYKQIMIDGKVHAVNSPEEEFFLLNEFLAKSRAQYELDIVKKKSPVVKRKIKVLAATITRTENRIDKVSEELQWRSKIKREDEEILALLTA